MIYAVDYEEQVNRSIHKKDSATPVLWCVLQLNPVQGCSADVRRVKGGEIYVWIKGMSSGMSVAVYCSQRGENSRLKTPVPALPYD